MSRSTSPGRWGLRRPLTQTTATTRWPWGTTFELSSASDHEIRRPRGCGEAVPGQAGSTSGLLRGPHSLHDGPGSVASTGIYFWARAGVESAPRCCLAGNACAGLVLPLWVLASAFWHHRCRPGTRGRSPQQKPIRRQPDTQQWLDCEPHDRAGQRMELARAGLVMRCDARGPRPRPARRF